MAFQLVKHDIYTGNPPLVYQFKMTDNEAATLGEALIVSSGRLTAATGANVPEWIAGASVAAATASTTVVPVYHVNEEQVFKTTSTGSIVATAIGNKYQLHTTGLQINTTTASGIFTVLTTNANTASSTVTGYFRR
jgi:hypothetical protein